LCPENGYTRKDARIEPKHDGLEDDVPLPGGPYSQVPAVHLPGCLFQKHPQTQGSQPSPLETSTTSHTLEINAFNSPPFGRLDFWVGLKPPGVFLVFGGFPRKAGCHQSYPKWWVSFEMMFLFYLSNITNWFHSYLLNVQPENWGRCTQFDEHIFQVGWFNQPTR